MRVGFASVVLAAVVSAASLPGFGADDITIDFESATGVGALLGVDFSQTPAQNEGFEGFFWAWSGSGAVNTPPNAGFTLGSTADPDFDYVGGSGPQFVYLAARAGGTGYIATMDLPFDFLGAIFSSRVEGTLQIVGQEKTASGNGGGTYRDVVGASAIVVFGSDPSVVDFKTNDFRGIDRLVITSSDTTRRPFEWAMNDFSYAPVPEPGTWAMLGLGMMAVGFAVRRRKPRMR